MRASKIRVFVYVCVSVSVRWRPGAGLRSLSRHWRQRQLLLGALKLFEKCSCVEGHTSPASTLAACCPRPPTTSSPASAHSQKKTVTSLSLRSPPQHPGRGCPHACEGPPSHTRTRSHRAGHCTTGTHGTCIWHLHHWVHRLEDRSSLHARSVRPSSLISPRRTRESGKKICCVETPASPPGIGSCCNARCGGTQELALNVGGTHHGFLRHVWHWPAMRASHRPPVEELGKEAATRTRTRRCHVRALGASLH